MMVYFLLGSSFVFRFAGAVFCGGFDAPSCNLCYPDPTKTPASRSTRLSDFCDNDCEMQEGQCVISAKYKQAHLTKSQEMLSDMAELTGHLSKALRMSFQYGGSIPSLRNAIEAEQVAPSMLASVDWAFSALAKMQNTLTKEQSLLSTVGTQVSCGGTAAIACEYCMGDTIDSMKCNGDCMFKDDACILKSSAIVKDLGVADEIPELLIPPTVAGKSESAEENGLISAADKLPNPRREVTCGGHTARTCEMCVKWTVMNQMTYAEMNDHPERYCNGDCIWSYAHVERCVPRVGTEKLFVQQAADTLQAIVSTTSKGLQLLQQNAQRTGGKTKYTKPDQALDTMEGLLPQLSEEIGAAQVAIRKGMVSVSCGGNRARSCEDCVFGHDHPKDGDQMYAHCNGDCVWKNEMCVLRHDPLDRDANGLFTVYPHNRVAGDEDNKKSRNLRVSGVA